ncbi:MAG TPA: DUF2752 domain-containing protein [Thermoanaerobaculia bacterium]|nr:DUF2752 domain-containing protein [Thermoanaerobaculia bacterium]
MTRTIAIVFAAVGLLALLGGPYVDAFPPTCPFRLLTGRPCVFCGMSHAVAFAARGDFARASAAHPLWFVVLPLFAVWVGAMVGKRARLAWVLLVLFVLGTVWTAAA